MEKETFDEICSGIENDAVSLREMCRRLETNTRTFYDYIERDKEAEKQYSRSMELRSHMLRDEIIEIADNEPNPKRAAVRVDARKWTACHLNPRKYGDKLDVTSAGNELKSPQIIEIVNPYDIAKRQQQEKDAPK